MKKYPIPAPAEDPGFSMGLILQVAKLLEERGFPKIDDGSRIWCSCNRSFSDLSTLPRAWFPSPEPELLNMMTESELALMSFVPGAKVSHEAISAESERVISECEELVKLHRMTLRDALLRAHTRGSDAAQLHHRIATFNDPG